MRKFYHVSGICLKKKYHSPQLLHFGNIKQCTTSGSGMNAEIVMVNMMTEEIICKGLGIMSC